MYKKNKVNKKCFNQFILQHCKHDYARSIEFN